jgi:hypothetical protein
MTHQQFHKIAEIAVDVQSDLQENKSRVLSHLLFYRNVCLSLIVHIDMSSCYTECFYWLPTFRKIY